MNISVPKPTTVHQCHWRMRDLGMGGPNGDCGANKRQKMSTSPSALCPHFPSLKMTHHQQQQQQFRSPTAPPAVVYQQQRGQQIPSNGAREQFEFIDGTAGSNVEGDRNNNNNNDDAKQRQFPPSSLTSSPIPHQLLQQGEPHRLIAREMSSGDIHTQEENAKILFGPFFRLTKPFFADEFPQRRRIVKRLFFVAMSLMLVGRAIYYFSQIGKSMNLSLDWARASLQVSLTLNALGAIGWMHKNSGFPRQFVRNLLAAIGQNRRPKCSTGTILGAGVISIFFIFTSAIWALMRILELQLVNQVKTMPAANNSNGSFNDYYDYLKTNESNGFSIENIYKVSLTCLDSFLALLSGILGALALAIFYLSFQSVLAQWKEFKKEQIDENIENGRMNQPDTLNRLSISASALLRFAHFTGNQFEQLGTGMFMTAIFCNISATFIGGVTGIKESSGEGPAAQWPLYEILEKINNFSWSILSIILLVITLKGPYDVHSKIREIKEQLLLEDSLWTGNDEKLTSCAKNFIQRLGGIRIHRIGTQLFQLVFIAQMVLVWLLISGSNSSTAKKI